MFGAQLSPGKNVDAALKTLTGTLETLDKKPFTAQELERARSKWLTSWEQVYSDPEQVGVALSEAIAAGDWRLFFLQRDRARKATLGDVQKAATSYGAEQPHRGPLPAHRKPQRARRQRVDLSEVFRTTRATRTSRARRPSTPRPPTSTS